MIISVCMYMSTYITKNFLKCGIILWRNSLMLMWGSD